MQWGKWIWVHTQDRPDEYADFYTSFDGSGGKVTMQLACDSNYELYVNGQLAGFGAYADHPHDKVFDTLELTPFCRVGENRVSLLVWYIGADFYTYTKHLPGVIFEIFEDGMCRAASGEETLCRIGADYVSGNCHVITGQMGYSYTCDMRGDDGWRRADFVPGADYVGATVVDGRPGKLRPRPIDKLVITGFSEGVLIDQNACIYDLGRETVGYFGIRFRAPRGAVVTVHWSEHLRETPDAPHGRTVVSSIGGRDFTLTLIASGDWDDFSNHMRRLGCRYLRVTCDAPLVIERIGLYEAQYPVQVLPYDAGSCLRRRIYDTCVRTLRLCMFEHYEDCPWREQSLYNMDSRNQMLCGYLAFGETRFARASLELFGQDRRGDGLLNICAPCRLGPPIPSFSLIYPIQMREYLDVSDDLALIRAYYGKMEAIFEAFECRARTDGLVPAFPEREGYWNFYEWSPTLDGYDKSIHDTGAVDLCLNALLSIAMTNMAHMAECLGYAEEAAGYVRQAEAINKAIRKVFYDEATGLYRTTTARPGASMLGCALAILCGAATPGQAREICAYLAAHDPMLVPVSLSMKVWVYDALLATDENAYASHVLADIDGTYERMLACGATSFWETKKGAADFGWAGSLCHGWSAIPILYYHRLLKK